GNLTLKFRDIHLPGPNGFDLDIWRVYNSKALKDNFVFNTPGFQQEPKSWVGMGWNIHMGRLHNFNSDEPGIEFPDGRWETAYPDINNTGYCVTRSFLRLNKTTNKLYFKDGTVWTFGAQRSLNYAGSQVQVMVVTRIENSYGHHIDIVYRNGLPVIDTITDSFGRVVTFVTDGNASNPRLSRIQVLDYSGSRSTYSYSVGTYSNNGYFKLNSYDPPEIPATTFTYNDDNQNMLFELSRVTTGFGAVMEYQYHKQQFYFYGQALNTRVVSEKRIRFANGESFHTWNYTYPDYNGGDTGTVVVHGPESNITGVGVADNNTYVTYHGFPSTNNIAANAWKIGLLKEKRFSDGSFSEALEWTNYRISNNNWVILNQNLDKIRAPLQSMVTRTIPGDAVSVQSYVYGRSGVTRYGLPTRVNSYGGILGTTLLNYKELTYYFETNSAFRNSYMMSYVSNECLKDTDNVRLKETQTTYFTSGNSNGALDRVRKWQTGSTYLTWNYGYSGSNPNTITITCDLPGSGGTETRVYSYGVLSSVRRPTYTELTRTISPHTSAVTRETNQHGGIMNFFYDALGRVDTITMPSGFNNINTNWQTNQVTITQGSASLTKYWDGMGRDTGYTETGAGLTLYFRKNLDAEGHVVSENKGSTSIGQLYRYAMNAAGGITTITDPLNNVTGIQLTDNEKKVTDANGNVTTFYYTLHPGLAGNLTDAANKSAVFDRDDAGRLTSVRYNNARAQSYTYNGLDQVVTETHPETGCIEYHYDTSNRIEYKKWGGRTTSYTYNASNQVRTESPGDETITYDYDTRGRLSRVGGSGWYRDSFSYNLLGSLLTERQNIPGIGLKSLSYTYDSNNNPETVTYPTGRTATMSNNALNMPNTLSFNGKSLISSTTYGINKQITNITVSGNGTSQNATYNNLGLLTNTDLKKGSTSHYRAAYTHDKTGNIKTIYDTIPSLNASFDYDSRYRLESASYTGGNTYAYTYDDYGNMLTARRNGTLVMNRSYTNQNRISDVSYDTFGNQLSSGTTAYQWDRRHRVSGISINNGESIAAFTYNERGLRLIASRAVAPAITLTAPTAGTTLYKTKAYNIQWTSTGFVGNNVKIGLYANGSPVLTFSGSTANDGLFNWLIPSSLAAGTYSIEVRSLDDSVTGSSGTLTIADSLIITTLSPNGGETLQAGNVHAVTWRTSGPAGNMDVSYSTSGVDGTFVPIAQNVANTGRCNWTVPDVDSSQCLVRVATADGLFSDLSNREFTIRPAPRITVLSPNGGESLGTGMTHQVTWNAVSLSGTVTIRLYRGDTYLVPLGTASASAGSFSWTIPLNQYYGTDYRVRVFLGSVGDFSDGCFSIGVRSYYVFHGSDFTGDGSDDIAIYRQSNGRWCVMGQPSVEWGAAGDIPVPGDYNGDGTTDFAIYRPSTGRWCVKGQPSIAYGTATDIPVPGDYDGNGTTDIAIFRPSTGRWCVMGQPSIAWGTATDIPVPGDYDGNGTTDIAIFRRSIGGWCVRGNSTVQWGTATDIPIPADYNGDGKTQFAVYRPSTGRWCIMGQPSIAWGVATDIPVPADYDGDGSDDIAIFRPSNGAWSVRGNTSILYGVSTDIPLVSHWANLPPAVDVEDGAGDIFANLMYNGEMERVTGSRLQVAVGRLSAHQDAGTGFYAHSYTFDTVSFPYKSAFESHALSGPNNEISSSVASGGAPLTNTYYIYSYDGKLMAEYNHANVCTKEYIYLGGRMVAEYQPPTGNYYYYMNDQINSTRMITDDLGNVVYSEAYGPYGDVQKTWNTTYGPKQKFSGKEREAYSDLDYFGARYFD
ncbi:MAG: hypothetical protein GY765_14065, partial [bacterium]|nr:hypothetical protein [bacterium]